ncbi:MAG TPA: hypothetical protein VHG27_01330 [Xanthobacteraceae bacterium]|nr:hypothetical protein [Xanthobacteraceae bacterium]
MALLECRLHVFAYPLHKRLGHAALHFGRRLKRHAPPVTRQDRFETDRIDDAAAACVTDRRQRIDDGKSGRETLEAGRGLLRFGHTSGGYRRRRSEARPGERRERRKLYRRAR